MDRSGTLLVVLVAAIVLSGGTGAAAAGNGLGSLQSGGVETDAVVLQAVVDENGDASWTIDYRIELDDENTTAAFESLQEDIRNNSSDYRGQFATRMRSTVAAAENATGREMAVSNVTVSTRTTLDGQYGIVSYSFRWNGFAATEDDQIVVGDALAGMFLDGDTTLTFSWPAGYELQRIDPPPDDESERSVTWKGPIDFGTDEPRLVVAEPGLLPSWAPYVAVLLLLALAGGLWYARRGEGVQPDETAGTPATVAEEGVAGSGGDSAGSQDDAVGEASQPDAATTTEGATAGERERGSGAAPEEAGAGTGTAETDTPEELLSPEERVLGLLEENGGRMKQKVVTEELDWSAARTSQVVGDLRDAGKVESFRLGRENVLKFPEDDEEESRSR
jgi:uncharacterized membrane protein